MKKCTKCNTKKSVTEFPRRKDRENRRQNICRECQNAKQRDWRSKNREKHHKWNKEWYYGNVERAREYSRKYYLVHREKIAATKRKRHYGITEDDFKLLIEKQNYSCKICGKSFGATNKLCVDHCHTTGEIRGILCRSCNTGIGSLKDDISILKKAIEYLEEEIT